MKTIAIIGAGVAGLGVAYALRGTGATVTLFEKSRGLGGRAATRRKNGAIYDHGANYVKYSDGPVDNLITLPHAHLIVIDTPVWVFDANGQIAPSDQQDSLKWSYTTGITQLAKTLYAASDATLVSETRIVAFEREGQQWALLDEAGNAYGPFDALVLTPPAPQTLELINASAWHDPAKATLCNALASVSYRSIFSFVLNYPFTLDLPWYAIVNTDRQHPIGWLSREECKAGHVPVGQSLLIVQMAADWTVDHYDVSAEELLPQAAALVADLLNDARLAHPAWYDLQRWRYALPNNGLDPAALVPAEAQNLYCAGDGIVGQGRVYLALENGLDVGARLKSRLGS